MKKLFSAVMLLIMCAAMCGCMAKMPEGYNEIKAAKTKYEQLDSGRTTMTDLSTGELILDFSFLINKSDEMILNYYGKDGQDEFYAYSDGAQYFYKDAGDELWSVIDSSDEHYIYNLYNRENRYPYATGGIFFLDGNSVETAEVTETESGSTITYIYDAEKLNQSAVSFLEGVKSFSSLTTVFELDENGRIYSFTESGEVTDINGTVRNVNLRIDVEKMNEVYDIPYPVDQLDKSGSKDEQTPSA